MKFIRIQGSILNITNVRSIIFHEGENKTKAMYLDGGGPFSLDGDCCDELWALIKEAQKPAVPFDLPCPPLVELKLDEPDEDEEISLDSEFTKAQAIINLEGDIALLGSRIQQRSEVTTRRFDEVHARLARLEEDNAKTQYPGLPVDNGCQR